MKKIINFFSRIQISRILTYKNDNKFNLENFIYITMKVNLYCIQKMPIIICIEFNLIDIN